MAPENPRPTRPHAGLVWSQVLTLYQRELQGALRDKTIVFNSLIIPVFLYPFLLWAAFSGLLLVMGQTEGKVSRILATHWPSDHPGLRQDFRRATDLSLRPDLA